jgi:hypothetical protein
MVVMVSELNKATEIVLQATGLEKHQVTGRGRPQPLVNRRLILSQS